MIKENCKIHSKKLKKKNIAKLHTNKIVIEIQQRTNQTILLI